MHVQAQASSVQSSEAVFLLGHRIGRNEREAPEVATGVLFTFTETPPQKNNPNPPEETEEAESEHRVVFSGSAWFCFLFVLNPMCTSWALCLPPNRPP